MKFLFPTLMIGLLLTSFVKADEPDVAFLKNLVNVNSGTKNANGVNQMQNLVKSKWEELGFQTQLIKDPKPDSPYADLLVATYAGEKPEFITFVMHTDTVFEKESGFLEFKMSDDGKTATGPGVIDDKGGILVALKGLQNFLKAHPKPKYSLRVLVSSVEEIGASGFYETYQKFSKDSVMVLGFEPALADGSIVESRRGNRWYHIKVTGKEGHAGRAHHQSANACHELAIKIDKLQKLTNYDKNATVSIGHIEGGKDKFNIVCGFAEAKIDVRASDFATFAKLHEEIDAILKTTFVKAQDGSASTATTYEIADDCAPFAVTATSKPWLEKYLSVVSKIENKTVGSDRSGGAADTNYMSREGLIILDGLGATGTGLHTEEETLEVSSLKTRSQALAEFLGEVDGFDF